MVDYALQQSTLRRYEVSYRRVLKDFKEELELLASFCRLTKPKQATALIWLLGYIFRDKDPTAIRHEMKELAEHVITLNKNARLFLDTAKKEECVLCGRVYPDNSGEVPVCPHCLLGDRLP